MSNKSYRKDSLGDRQKGYELAYKFILPRRFPIIIRLDIKSAHTFTRSFEKPYDDQLMTLMDKTAKYLCENIQGAQIAYVQSDEITVLIHGYKTFDSEPWFANEVQKMVSISAALASSYFSMSLENLYNKLRHRGYEDFVRPVQFDSRAFAIPEHDVCNNFIWRQQDWERNSIQMFGLSMFSQKELHGCSCKKIVEKCEVEKQARWADLPTSIKRGRCIRKVEAQDSSTPKRHMWIIDHDIPIFKEDRNYIEQYLATEDPE